MATTTITGSRIALLGMPSEAYSEYECTACGQGLRGVREVVAVPRRGIHSPGITVYSLVHNEASCLAVVS